MVPWLSEIWAVPAAGLTAAPAASQVAGGEDRQSRAGIDVRVVFGAQRLVMGADDPVEIGVVGPEPCGVRHRERPRRQRAACRLPGRAGIGNGHVRRSSAATRGRAAGRALPGPALRATSSQSS